MIGIKPYLTFNGNCKEAINFYKEALSGEILFSQTFGDSPMKGQGADELIMHTSLKIGDSVLMASDSGSPEHAVNVGNNISLALGSDDISGAEKMFDRLAEGGKVNMPMQETFWAERFGMLTDKFGINWMFNCEKAGMGGSSATA